MFPFWFVMEEEIISQHCATAGCFYCMHKPPALVLTLALLLYCGFILESIEGLLSQSQF